jgi:hypothetical protein
MSIQALRSFQLPTTVLLLLLNLPMEVMMTMITVVTIILLIQLIHLGPALKACPILGDHPVRPVLPDLAKALWVEVVVVEVAAMVMVVRQVLPAGNQLQIPMRLCLFRLSLLFGMPSTSGIGKPQLLVLPSRISGTRTPLMGPIRPNLICSSPSATSISPSVRRISPPMTTKSFS